MAKQTYWLDGRQIDEDEAFDAQSVMRDGVSMRVKTMMRDGVEVAKGIMMCDEPVPLGDHVVTDSEGRMLVDAYGSPLSPKYGRKGYTFVDTSNRERKIDDTHPDMRKAALSNAWKGGAEPGDVIIVDGRTLVGAGYTRHTTRVCAR